MHAEPNRFDSVHAKMACRPLKILVAEDDKLSHFIMARLLEKQGHQLVPAFDGLQCLQTLDQADFDLIIMDIQMPCMGGIEATQQIRVRQDEKRNIPIIALTAHVMEGDRERFIAAGMDDYLSKPLDLLAMNQLLGRLFAGRE